MHNSEQLFSRKELAKRWRVSEMTVRRAEKAGLLHPLRFNQRLVRYETSDVVAAEQAARGAIK